MKTSRKIWVVALRYAESNKLYKGLIEENTDMPNDIYQMARKFAIQAKNENLPGVKDIYINVIFDNSEKTAQQLADETVFSCLTTGFKWESVERI